MLGRFAGDMPPPWSRMRRVMQGGGVGLMGEGVRVAGLRWRGEVGGEEEKEEDVEE